MISTLSTQAGRRYPQFGSTWTTFVGRLPSVGETAATPIPDVVVATGGKGDNQRHRSRKARPAIYKPTGLLDRRRLNPTADPIVEARIEQSIEIAREIAAENDERQQEVTDEQRNRILAALDVRMRDNKKIQADIQAEVDAIIAEARRMAIEEDEIIVLLLAGSL